MLLIPNGPINIKYLFFMFNVSISCCFTEFKIKFCMITES